MKTFQQLHEMTDKEILEKAIRKATEDGWDKWGWLHFEVDDTLKYITFSNKKKYYNSPTFITKEIESVIFNHSFAKGLWGTHIIREHIRDGLVFRSVQNWEEHIQQMVIAEDPIAYLAENI